MAFLGEVMKIVESLGLLPPTEFSTYKTEFVVAECPLCSKLFRVQFRAIKKKQKSCGCLRKDGSRFVTTKHLRTSQPRLYRIWKNMRTRCNNPNIPQAQNYGARGINVCQEWNNFGVFYDWALGNGYTDALSIDRIDVNGNYTPTNCCWATRAQQGENTQLLRTSNTSGYRGVYKKGTRYAVRATNFGVRVFLGTFDTAAKAALAYDAYIIENNLKYPVNFSKEKDKK
jgi:hypothetical protein